MSDLYETDILAWSERQRDLLRRFAAGEAVNETPAWPNIIEEIEGVGREQLHAMESLLAQAITHILKVQAWPHAPRCRAGRSRLVGSAAKRPIGSRRPCEKNRHGAHLPAGPARRCRIPSTAPKRCRFRRPAHTPWIHFAGGGVTSFPAQGVPGAAHHPAFGKVGISSPNRLRKNPFPARGRFDWL